MIGGEQSDRGHLPKSGNEFAPSKYFRLHLKLSVISISAGSLTIEKHCGKKVSFFKCLAWDGIFLPQWFETDQFTAYCAVEHLMASNEIHY
jgi:hypothetical protein